MTVYEATTALLRYLKPEQRTLPPAATEDDPLPDCLVAMNSGLSEFLTLGPLFQFRAPLSARIYAPTTITIASITDEASTFSYTSLPSWMVGCSILISGEATWNQIVSYSGTTVTLRNPIINGAGTNVSAQVFCDSISLPSNVLQVLPPVALADAYELSPVKNENELNCVVYDYWRTEDYGRNASTNRAQRRTNESPAPRVYWNDTYYGGGATAGAQRLRLGPMPTADNILNYRARISTPRYVTADIHSGGTPASVEIPVRADLADTVLMPIIRQRFTVSPLFRNDSALPEIKRDYEAAYAIAKKMRPQGASGIRVQPGF